MAKKRIPDQSKLVKRRKNSNLYHENNTIWLILVNNDHFRFNGEIRSEVIVLLKKIVLDKQNKNTKE